MYSRVPFAPTGASPPVASLLSNAFSTSAPLYSTSPTAERHAPSRHVGAPLLSSISDPLAFGSDARPPPAIMIRKLPRNISHEALGSMLIFAGDLIDTEIIRSPYQDDKGFATAVARFQTHRGALEAQQKLDGKPNTTKEANMIVEVHSGSMVGALDRRNTIDTSASRTQSGPSSISTGGRSRYNGSFQSTDKVSPPLPTPSSGGSGEFPIPESSSHLQTLFSPQSPVANGVDDRRRVTGKSMITNDAVDDETGELLKDPIGYAQSGQQLGRRPTNPQIPVGRFGNLSLSTPVGNLGSPPSNGVTSPRAAPSMQSPTSPTGPGLPGGGANGMYHPMNYPRHQYPPINPADQNPPCNTLYVGNLPINTAEDELKTIFSKQRGYKRLCFRTKQNGPMCFVEFEDISFATKALNELYGHPLSNSQKGGIRLSFSKNPLGVRSGQVPTGPSGPLHGPMNPHALSSAYGGPVSAPTPQQLNPSSASASAFSSVQGPPPGLSTPPGLMHSGFRPGVGSAAANGGGLDGMFAHPFSPPLPSSSGGSNFPLPQDFSPPSHPLRPQTLSGGVPPSMNASYGREGRWGEYMVGR